MLMFFISYLLSVFFFFLHSKKQFIQELRSAVLNVDFTVRLTQRLSTVLEIFGFSYYEAKLRLFRYPQPDVHTRQLDICVGFLVFFMLITSHTFMWHTDESTQKILWLPTQHQCPFIASRFVWSDFLLFVCLCLLSEEAEGKIGELADAVSDHLGVVCLLCHVAVHSVSYA